VNPRKIITSYTKITLLFAGYLLASPCIAHWEGFEAADPSTPAALLTYTSPINSYHFIEIRRISWTVALNSKFGETQPKETQMSHKNPAESSTAEMNH
tara:strand:- start:1246 stop:1539 length:294 start_codon:yes stop_codon:yes gene_type:complete